MSKVSCHKTRKHTISWIRIMWIIIFFDLPVGTDVERKAATKFRNDLLDSGFLMAQFSVYYKLAGTREHADKLARDIQAIVPPKGSINILTITDKQYANMICIVGKKKKKAEAPEQLLLF